MSMLVHGGPDARGIPAHDFSTNANACGPCPAALAAVLAADRVRYPDPAYAALRERLGRLHGVARERIVIAASASEFIRRMTAFAVRQGLGQVVVPRHGFGDYAAAAAAWGLALRAQASEGRPALLWGCEPSSPLGRADEVLAQTAPAGSIRILDRAYAPLRMAGEPAPVADDIWQLWSPNKALGMTGVRAAYAIAPDAARAQAMEAMAPSWPLGADGVALLHAWAGAQAWVRQSLDTLRVWKAAQLARCTALGWDVVPGSLANFFTVRLHRPDAEVMLAALREQGIKLRDCTSFGLPGHARLGVLAPSAQDALARAWRALADMTPARTMGVGKATRVMAPAGQGPHPHEEGKP